ncbi:MAG: glycosyltransferase family 4 protein [Xanthomonadales bacterium]|nr:glycosyltransferase family 4 protein [Xanthomonadales bacterium]
MNPQAARPRLLALVTDGFAGHGGIAQYNRDLLSALAERWEVHVLARYDQAAATPPAGIRQYPSCRGRVAYARAGFRLARRLRPAVLFAGHVQFAALAHGLSASISARLTVQTHGIDVWSAPRAWNRAAVESADLVLAVSRDTRRRVLSWAELPTERVRVLSNTVRELFRPGDRQAARQRFAPGAERLIVTVGRLSPAERYKGHDRVIASLPMLQRRWPGVRYLIAGRGADRERLQALAAHQGVGSAVEFLDLSKDEDLVDLYLAADVMALPSTGEGFGIAFVEALRCATPVLGLAVAGATDPLSLFPQGAADAASVGEGLARLLAEPGPVSAEVCSRLETAFGRASFTARALATFDSLMPGAPR